MLNLMNAVGGAIKDTVASQTRSPGKTFLVVFFLAFLMLIINALIVFYIFNALVPVLVARFSKTKDTPEMLAKQYHITFLESLLLAILCRVLFA
jgi:hypothetical protein